jgi:hypothetical protein
VRSSRKYKFYLLFFSIGLYVVGLILIESNQDEWAEQQFWIININNNIKECRATMLEVGATRIGLDKTFESSSVLFSLVGMGFGCSYSLVEVDCIDWVKTSMPKRLIRAVIGTGLALGVFALAELLSVDNQHLTQYMI